MNFRRNLKQWAWVGVMAMGIGMTGGAARMMASPTAQEHHDEDYSKNKNYQMGMQDGHNDQMHNRDHYKKRHFKKDEDQKAYEAGYQAGRNPDHH